MAIPNIILLITNNDIFGEAPVNMEPNAKIRKVTIITFFRPAMSVIIPDPKVPSIAPINTAVVMSP